MYNREHVLLLTAAAAVASANIFARMIYDVSRDSRAICDVHTYMENLIRNVCGFLADSVRTEHHTEGTEHHTEGFVSALCSLPASSVSFAGCIIIHYEMCQSSACRRSACERKTLAQNSLVNSLYGFVNIYVYCILYTIYMVRVLLHFGCNFVC